MASSYESFKELDLTRDEVERIGNCLKDKEFRKLFTDYVTEIQDPENKKLYQKEITELEKERGVDVTFLNPVPGYVIKTSVNGTKKCFINVCSNEHVRKPSSSPAYEEGSKGLQWSIPHSICPVREDMDKKNVRCAVYDVLFHADTLHLASNNKAFRSIVNKTACEAIESNFGVSLDKNNLKFPKLTYKGFPEASVIRKPSKNGPKVRDPEDQLIYDKLMSGAANYEPKSPPKAPRKDVPGGRYTKPAYTIKHRTHVDMQDFTEDRDSKIGLAIPKELVLEVNLPLLKSANDMILDVTEKSVHLVSEKPAKYELEVALPYFVNSEAGNAKFDKDRKTLVVVLPVRRENLSLGRDDSGVESDHGSSSPSDENLVTELKVCNKSIVSTHVFLDPNLHYSLPDSTCHVFENVIAFTLNVKNVEHASVKKVFLNPSMLHIKFATLSSGFFPQHYALYLNLPTHTFDQDDLSVEIWDNNVVLQSPFKPSDVPIETYYIGTDEASKTLNRIRETSIVSVNHDLNSDDEDDDTNDVPQTDSKTNSHQTKAIDICSTYSESSGDELSCSYSPSKSKGILKRLDKRTISRSISESSIDDFMCGSSENCCASVDSVIPEDGEVSTSLKKTVRFNDNVSKQLYRSNSSILGQKKKNQRKAKAKKRAHDRRCSESEASESDDKKEGERKTQTDTKSEEKGADSDFSADVFQLDMYF